MSTTTESSSASTPPQRGRQVAQEEDARRLRNSRTLAIAFWLSVALSGVLSAWLVGSYLLQPGGGH